MSVTVTHAVVVPPVLMDILVSHAIVLMEQLVTDVSVSNYSRFFLHEVTFVQLDELEKLDRITHASIGFNNSSIQA